MSLTTMSYNNRDRLYRYTLVRERSKIRIKNTCRMDEEYESINECSLIDIKYWLKKTLIYQGGNELGSFSGSVQNH